jgi:hypothetical protein
MPCESRKSAGWTQLEEEAKSLVPGAMRAATEAVLNDEIEDMLNR